MASTENISLLDHIIVLLPHQELLDPPKWLTENFNITDGGKHADGKTENKLIVFQDGTYIELISFINDLPENRAGHWWGTKPYSIIDWAFTTETNYNTHHEGIVSRLHDLQTHVPTGERYSYAPPQTGGRIRPDGVRLEWAVTFPIHFEKDGSTPMRPSNLPFFCHDITPRENRVNGFTNHPCGATGLREVRILADQSKVGEYSKYIRTVVNSSTEGEKISVGVPAGPNGSVVFVTPTTEDGEAQVQQRGFILKELTFNFTSDVRSEFSFSYPK
ncbi:hypothetical protein TWF694_008841 [Orbilia ellipsospora]|uniref:Glyoxalase-like domain-containing protein n=1 Tax=Orbilia ellipsospora TaxID=2528407 RepID=A0AAV9XD35_9PEZI